MSKYPARSSGHQNNLFKLMGWTAPAGPTVDAQVRQLVKAGCKKVFREVASGAKTDRAQLRKALATLEAGDVLTVTRLDRPVQPGCLSDR